MEAVPLLLGVDPAGWAACRQGEVAAWAAALDARLGADLGVASEAGQAMVYCKGEFVDALLG